MWFKLRDTVSAPESKTVDILTVIEIVGPHAASRGSSTKAPVPLVSIQRIILISKGRISAKRTAAIRPFADPPMLGPRDPGTVPSDMLNWQRVYLQKPSLVSYWPERTTLAANNRGKNNVTNLSALWRGHGVYLFTVGIERVSTSTQCIYHEILRRPSLSRWRERQLYEVSRNLIFIISPTGVQVHV
jgi:hypothetical protein